MFQSDLCGVEVDVAPLAGAWIEISSMSTASSFSESLPSRERGLKYGYGQKRNVRGAVAPLAGAWIEIVISLISKP